MAFAIIETGGKQYKVSEGDVLNVEKLEKGENNTITFDKVLLINDGTKTTIGTPYITGASLTAEFVADVRGKKVMIVKYKAKVRHKKINGHRQPYTQVKIGALK